MLIAAGAIVGAVEGAAAETIAVMTDQQLRHLTRAIELAAA
jgi:hypothetical protein